MESSKSITAVEWLMDKLFDPTFDNGKQIDWFEQAKEMEKQQIIDSVKWYMNTDGIINQDELAEQYYNETFKL